MTRPHIITAADAAAAHVGNAVLGIWRELRRVLKVTYGYGHDRVRVQAVLDRLPHAVATAMHQVLRKAYCVAHRSAGNRLTWQGRTPEGRVTVLEDDESGIDAFFSTDPALTTLQAVGAQLDITERMRLFRSLLMEPPEESLIWRVLAPLVKPDNWFAIGDATRKLPHELAAQIAGGMSQGISQRDLAKSIAPYLDGSRMRAARAARTFGIHVAHSAQVNAWEGLGDLVIGYKIHSTKNPCPPSRPWHQARDGTIYYLNPKRGQKGMAQCPHPPMEADDPKERPAGTPWIAWNCLCWLSPVLSV
jgi:hypothetical protein